MALPDLMQQLRERNPTLHFDQAGSRFRAVFKNTQAQNDAPHFDRDLTAMLNELTAEIRFLRMSLSNWLVGDRAVH